MVLCEIDNFGNFLSTWIFIGVSTWAATMMMSGLVFLKYYSKPTYETWRYKTNPEYPKAPYVGDEVVQMSKGVMAGAICPAIALYLARHGLAKGYCGNGPNDEYGWMAHLFQFFVIWLGSDLYQFLYHRFGHMTEIGWAQHRHHHVFYNPTPFSVIADEYIDQFVRAAPLCLIPMIMPTNMDLLFGIYATFFYSYGIYLHWGFELEYPDAHHPIINTAFQHYWHHAVSSAKTPYYTGFYIKLWDNMFGSVYKGECKCAKCCREKGLRSQQLWDKLEKPDYSSLLTFKFWKDAWVRNGIIPKSLYASGSS